MDRSIDYPRDGWVGGGEVALIHEWQLGCMDECRGGWKGWVGRRVDERQRLEDEKLVASLCCLHSSVGKTTFRRPWAS